MGDLTESAPSSNNNNSNSGGATPNQRTLPIREDCWSEEATSTLVDAWGNRFVELNRGNLRQKDWQDVADAVNALHGHTKKTHRTDVQCKNRIDTLKKKYKVEKGRVVSSNGAFASTWPFFERIDSLIGSSYSGKKPPEPSVSPSPPMALPIRRSQASGGGGGILALPQKRPAPGDDEGSLRRNYSAMAAAAAAAAAYSDSEDGEEEEEDEEMEEVEGIGLQKGSGGGAGGVEGGEGMRRLAQAVERFGQVYEKVEREKLRQMVDLEKQRMKFAKDLEMERMRIFTETQIQLEKIKKGSGGTGGADGKIQQQLQQQHHHRSAAAGSNGEREY